MSRSAKPGLLPWLTVAIALIVLLPGGYMGAYYAMRATHDDGFDVSIILEKRAGNRPFFGPAQDVAFWFEEAAL